MGRVYAPIDLLLRLRGCWQYSRPTQYKGKNYCTP